MLCDLEKRNGYRCGETLVTLEGTGEVKDLLLTCDGPPASQMYEWVKNERIMYALCHSLSETRCSVDNTGS